MKSRSLETTTFHQSIFKNKTNKTPQKTYAGVYQCGKKKNFFLFCCFFGKPEWLVFLFGLCCGWKRPHGENYFQSRKLRKWNKVLWLEQREIIGLCISVLSHCLEIAHVVSPFPSLVEITIVRPHFCVCSRINLWFSQKYESLGCFKTHFLWEMKITKMKG